MNKLALLGISCLLSGSSMFAAAPSANPAAAKKAEAMEKAHQRLVEGTGMALDLPAEIMPLSPGKAAGKPFGTGELIPSADRLKNPRNPLAHKGSAPNRIDELNFPLYGYIAYDYVVDFEPGMFEFMPDGDYDFMWVDAVWSELEEGQITNGWLKDGQYQGIQAGYVPGSIYAYFWYSVDFETGELLEFEDYFGKVNFAFLQCAYNPEDDRVWGIGHDFTNTESRLWWASAPVDNLDNVELIAPVNQYVTDKPDENNMAYCMCYNPSDGYFYAVTVWGELVKIHKDGTQEPVLGIKRNGYALMFPSGLVWSPKDNYFIWSPYFSDSTSELVILDPTNEIEEAIFYYPTGPQISTLLTTDQPTVSPEKPLRAEINSFNFSNGSLSGYVEYTMPTKFANGNTIPAGTVLSYTALLDGEEYATGTAEAGATISVDYTVNNKGYHTFGIYTTYKDTESFTSDKKTWVGNDTPFPPTNVQLTQKLVTWDPVGNVGIHGGYVNPDEVTYTVWINNTEFAGSTQGTSVSVDLDSEEMESFIASVFAEFDGLSSKAGRSNRIVTGNPFTTPMFLQPTEEEFNLMTVVDANEDGRSWSYNDHRQALEADYSSKIDMDDYIFLPAVEITDTDYLYEFSLDAVVSDNAADYIEYLEVVWATEPTEEDLGGYIIDEFFPEGNVYYNIWTHKSGLWNVETPGVYYIGLHCTSPANQIGIFAKNLSLVKSRVTLDAPAAPVIKKIKSGSMGSLEAEVTVALPSKNYDGKPLDSDLEMTAHFILNGEEVEVTAKGMPGEEIIVTLPTEQGDNTVAVYLTAGELYSPVSEPYTIFTGQTVPSATRNVRLDVAKDMLSATVSWDPVTTADIPNGYVDPEDITYTIYIAKTQGEYPSWSLYKENVKETSFVFTLPSYSEMALYMFGVETRSPEGSNGEVVSSGIDMMGRPYSLPFIETFDDPYTWLTTEPWIAYNEYNNMHLNGTWMVTNLDELTDGAIENHPAVIGYSFYSKDFGLLGMPRFSTKGIEHAQISIPVLFAPYMAELRVIAKIYGSDDYIEVGSIDEFSNNIYLETVTFRLPDSLMDQDWVEIDFLAYYEIGYTFTAFTSVEVTPVNDAGVSETRNEGRIFGGKNSITVKGLEGSNVAITTLDGKQIATGTVKTDNEVYNVAPGIYLVSAGEKKVKVIVK